MLLILFCFFILYKKPKDVLENCMKSCVCINNKEFGSSGSGVIVKSKKVGDKFCNIMLSSAHIFCCDYRLCKSGYVVKIPIINNHKILFYKEELCYVQSILEDYDISVLIFYTDEELQCSSIDFNENLKFNDRIMKMGYGLGDDLRIDYGYITQLNMDLDSCKNLHRTNAFAIFGDSGGPVFKNNKLVAITQGIKNYDGSPIYNISYICPINNLLFWSEIENIDYCYENKEIPKISKYFLEFKKYEYIK